MTPEAAKQSATEQQPAAVDASATVPRRTAVPTREVTFDSALTISLLIREAITECDRSLATKGIGQAASAARRLEDVVAEIEALVALDAPRSAIFAESLSLAHNRATQVANVLAKDEKLGEYANYVVFQIEAIQQRIGASTTDSAAVVKPSTTDDHVQVVKQEIAATRKQVEIVVKSHPKDPMDAATLCAPLNSHLLFASAAAMKIDRTTREPLYIEVETLSTDMDRLARILAVEPKLLWQAAFASAFDGENRLRQDVGLPAKQRPYSGNVDPYAVHSFVDNAAKATLDGTSGAPEAQIDLKSASPEVSTSLITAHFGDAYQGMKESMSEFETLFSAVDVPSPSLGDVLLGMVVNLLLGSAAAGLASVIGKKLGDAIIAAPPSATQLAASLKATGAKVTDAEVEKMVEHLTVKNAAAVDGAKDGIGSFLKLGVDALMKKEAKTTEPSLLHRYVAVTQDKLTEAQISNRDHLILAARALAQLDPAVLRELAATTATLRAEAIALLRPRAFVEFEKLKTANALGWNGSGDPLLTAPKENKYQDVELPGVLELDFRVGLDDAYSFAAMKLLGSDPAGRAQLKAHPKRTRDAGLHRIFKLDFSALNLTLQPLRTFVTFGVGATAGLQLGTIDDEEWRYLRLFTSGERVDPVNAGLIALGDRFSERAVTPANVADKTREQVEINLAKAAVVQKLHAIIAQADALTTDKIEEP